MAEPAESLRGQLGPQNLAGRKLGRYEVLCQLASGGMAGVYVARAQGVAGFERLVAIKVLHPHLAHEDEFISMFLDEARLAARIRHPNVVPTLDVSDTEGDGYFLVMDYIDGDHLGALMQASAKAVERIPVPVTLRIVCDALGGLGAAHDLTDENGNALNLVHRDVSPHNVMVGVDGVSRLTDFGVAKAEVRLSSTREGQFKGKLAYMAPEHASHGQTDRRSDVFAMGIILWECLTGKRLFRGENNAATLNKILVEPIPLPSSALAELAPFDAVLGRALARDPEKRYQTAAELADAIEQLGPTVGGIATTRAVSEVVRKLAAPKLARDAMRIKEAMTDLGKLEVSRPVAPIVREGGSEPSKPSRTGSGDLHARMFSPDAVTMTAPGTSPSGPSAPLATPVAPPRKVSAALLGVIALVAIAVIATVAWLALRPPGTAPPVAGPSTATPAGESGNARAPLPRATGPTGRGTPAVTRRTADDEGTTSTATPTTAPTPPTTPTTATPPTTPTAPTATTDERTEPSGAEPSNRRRRRRTGTTPTGGGDNSDDFVANPYRR